MVRFLGDFLIDEYPDISLSNKEIIILAYSLLKGKSFYLNELVDLFYNIESIDKNYIKKIIKRLAKKLEEVVSVELKDEKVKFESHTGVDVIELEKLLKNYEQSYNFDSSLVKNVLDIYQGHFLPFIDNIWVNGFRNSLKITLIKLLTVYFYSNEIFDMQLIVRITKILPELYLSSSMVEIYESFKRLTNVNIGIGNFEKFRDNIILRAVSLDSPDLRKILKSSESVEVISPHEFIIINDSKKVKEVSI